MNEIPTNPHIVAIAGPARAIVLARIIQRARREQCRGRHHMVYADVLLARDTGLPRSSVARARAYWQDIGIISSQTRGMPPTTEYDIAATLAAYDAWLVANRITAPTTPSLAELEAEADIWNIDLRPLRQAAQRAADPSAYLAKCIANAINQRREHFGLDRK